MTPKIHPVTLWRGADPKFGNHSTVHEEASQGFYLRRILNAGLLHVLEYFYIIKKVWMCGLLVREIALKVTGLIPTTVHMWMKSQVSLNKTWKHYMLATPKG